MRSISKFLTIAYFFICPIELILNANFGSSARYVGILLLAAYVFSIFVDRNANKRMMVFSDCTMVLTGWMIVCVVSLLWPNKSTFTFSYLKTYLQMGLLVIVLTQEQWTKTDIDLFLIVYWFGSVLMALSIIVLGETRYIGRETVYVFGRYLDPNQIAANVTPGLILSIHFLLNEESGLLKKLLFFLTMIVTGYALLLTGSRGALLSVIGAIAVYTFITIRDRGINFGFFLLAGLAIIFIIPRVSQLTINRLFDFSSYTDAYSNGENRLTIWMNLIRDIDIQWIVGHGVGSTITFLYGVYGAISGVHNTYLLVLYEVGLIGFSLFIFSFAKMIKYHIAHKHAVLVSILVSAMICSFLLDALNLRYIWNGLILCLMMYDNEERQDLPLVEGYQSRYIR